MTMLRWIAHLCLRRCCGIACLAILGATLAPAATRPDYEAARKFGYELQRDYTRRQSAALIDHLDEAAIRKKVYAAYATETTESVDAQELWKSLFGSFTSSLKELDRYRLLVLGRVMNLNGVRTLECELVSVKGAVQMMYLDLQEGADGKISIVDRRMLGEALSFATRTKQMLLLLGVGSTVQVGEEEMNLEMESRGQHAVVRFALDSIQGNDVNAAYRSWDSLSDSLKETAVWKDFRQILALRGATGALQSLESELREGKPGADPIWRFNYASSRGDNVAAARAIEEVLAETYDAPLFVALKCELLTRLKRPKESLQFATETYRLNPYSFSAYAAAIEAAVALGDNTTALQSLRAWSQVASADDIENMLKERAALAGLRSSSTYQEWLKSLPAPKEP